MHRILSVIIVILILGLVYAAMPVKTERYYETVAPIEPYDYETVKDAYIPQ